ncbi:hypothetical protein DsansV1_C22g0170331 [Dioscorea sansibarensis]
MLSDPCLLALSFCVVRVCCCCYCYQSVADVQKRNDEKEVMIIYMERMVHGECDK